MKNQVQIDKIIKPFNKQITVPSDKSLSIRCVLFSSIALGKSKIFNLLQSEDVTNSIKGRKFKFVHLFGLCVPLDANLKQADQPIFTISPPQKPTG